MGTWRSSMTGVFLWSHRPHSFNFHSQSSFWTAYSDSASWWWRSKSSCCMEERRNNVMVECMKWCVKRIKYRQYYRKVYVMTWPKWGNVGNIATQYIKFCQKWGNLGNIVCSTWNEMSKMKKNISNIATQYMIWDFKNEAILPSSAWNAMSKNEEREAMLLRCLYMLCQIWGNWMYIHNRLVQ